MSLLTRLATDGAIVREVDSDPALAAAKLKKVATALNLGLPATVKSKQAIQLYIAENVVRDRGRWRLKQFGASEPDPRVRREAKRLRPGRKPVGSES